MDPYFGASLHEEERHRLHENSHAAVSAVKPEEAAQRDEDGAHSQEDQASGSAVQSPEHPTHVPARAQQHQRAAGPRPDTYRISNSIRPKAFYRMFQNGEEVQQTVMVFANRILAHFEEEDCLDAVERDAPIMVASAGVSPEALNKLFGHEAVARATVA